MHYYARMPHGIDDLVMSKREAVIHDVRELPEFGAADLLGAFPDFRVTYDRSHHRFGCQFDGIVGAGVSWRRAEWIGEFGEGVIQLMDRAVRELLGGVFVAFREEAQWWYARPQLAPGAISWEIASKNELVPTDWDGLLADFQQAGFKWPGGDPQ